jgi:chromosome segregation ATPase
VLLKFELEDLKTNFSKFDKLHEQDLASIVRHADQVAKLKVANADLEARNGEQVDTISDINSQLTKTKEECSVLMRQVLELQSQAMASNSLIESARHEESLETRCSDLLRENTLLAQNLQTQHNKVEELQKVIETGEGDRESIIKLQVQLKLQQKLYTESQARVDSLSREILDLRLENSKFQTQIETHQAHSIELKERLDQNINLLETLTNSTKSNSENAEYQVIYIYLFLEKASRRA